MFDELSEGILRLFSWRWPSCDGAIVSLDTQEGLTSRHGVRIVLAVGYEFSVNRINYAGEYFWDPASAPAVLAAKDTLKVGQSVTVRYRSQDPNINTLNRKIFDDLLTGL